MSIRLKQKITRRVLRYFGVVEDPPSKASVEPVPRTDDLEPAVYRMGTGPLVLTFGGGFEPLVKQEHTPFKLAPAPQHPLAPELCDPIIKARESYAAACTAGAERGKIAAIDSSKWTGRATLAPHSNLVEFIHKMMPAWSGSSDQRRAIREDLTLMFGKGEGL